MDIPWKIGVEAELLAPRGLSRRSLAERLATDCGGTLHPFFHPQSEPSKVPGLPVFENLTLGFRIEDATGGHFASCVDDLTLITDLDRAQPSRPGWFRVVSDDMRLLRLVMRHGRADAGPLEAVAGVAELFGTHPQTSPDGMVRVADSSGASVAIGALLPGERERPCEVISPPIETDHAARLTALLRPAQELGFGLAAESATHIHFDARRLQSAQVLKRLIRLLHAHGPNLKRLLGTNPRCRRLGSWPDALHACIEAPDFAMLSWPQAQARLQTTKLSKYCDFNLANLVLDLDHKRTLEIRILPGMAHAQPILQAAWLFAGLLQQVCTTRSIPRRDPLPWSVAAVDRLIDGLDLPPALARHWHRQAAQVESAR